MQMQINRKRLEESMAALGRIGETPAGGLSRLALTDEDRRGRDLLVEWMRAAGLTVAIDRMGNIFGERPGREGLPPVMMGSHADSVPTGGKYDGQLGVLCALEAIRTLNDNKTATRHPVAMAIFTNEEGARFQPAMIGSGVMAGQIALEDALGKLGLVFKRRDLGLRVSELFADHRAQIRAVIETQMRRVEGLSSTQMESFSPVPLASVQPTYRALPDSV